MAERQGGKAHLRAEELCGLAARGDTEAFAQLTRMFLPLISRKARSYFIPGAGRDDVIQEGLIGLFHAVGAFDPARGGSFQSFADRCITHQILTAVKAAARRKHSPLNSYLSFEDAGGEACPAGESPEKSIIDRERFHFILDRLKERLSSLERRILTLYLQGLSYREIAERIGRSEKSVDNAISRVKRKSDLIRLHGR